MIRLMLLLAPSAAALGGLGASWVIDVGATSLRAWWARDMLGDGADAEGAREEAQKGQVRGYAAMAGAACTWLAPVRLTCVRPPPAQAGQGAWDGGVDSEGDRAWLEHQGIAVSEGAEAGLARLRSFRLSVDDDSGDDAAPQAEGGAEGAGGTRRASAEGGNGVGAPGRAGQEARRAFAERKASWRRCMRLLGEWKGAHSVVLGACGIRWHSLPISATLLLLWQPPSRRCRYSVVTLLLLCRRYSCRWQRRRRGRRPGAGWVPRCASGGTSAPSRPRRASCPPTWPAWPWRWSWASSHGTSSTACGWQPTSTRPRPVSPAGETPACSQRWREWLAASGWRGWGAPWPAVPPMPLRLTLRVTPPAPSLARVPQQGWPRAHR